MGTTKVAVAMSGGIDSSVTALLLQEQGYDIVGITLQLWDSGEIESGCCSSKSVDDARAFAEKIGIPHFVVDVRSEFKNCVVKNFVDEYMSARTPNPCVVCNPNVKWKSILQKAEDLGCEKIATGHYAQFSCKDGRYFVTRGIDISKDQSYVMWHLSQEQLAKTMFPLGKYKKSEIRDLASKYGFVELVQKSESQEICFIPDDDYRSFLKQYVPDFSEKVKKGTYVSMDGKELGTHEGYPFYTIGQRKGLGIALGVPAYVQHVDKERNKITIGFRDDLLTNDLLVSNLYFSKYESLQDIDNLSVKIRYNTQPAPCTITSMESGLCKVHFENPVWAVTPGQSAVFYEGNDLVAGGIIER
ncbi:MAG: tRNA 2-thiouridine(34) synthase MnmA [Bacteroidales bacterium]|nr:tRNA 2-thiouridine(34) synthase MnmA [Bacteroidales bacterium]